MKQTNLLLLAVLLTACGQSEQAPVAANEPAPATPAPEPVAEATPQAAPEAPQAAPEAVESFNRNFELQGVGFRVQAQDGNVVITPTGLEVTNEPVQQPLEGMIVGAEAADLNADGSPEIYVFLQAGEPARAGLVAYAANRRKSLSQITLPALADDAKNSQGYAGNDELAVVENYLVRRFPLVDAAGKPTGTTRQLQYRLKPGEAGWQLVLDKASEF